MEHKRRTTGWWRRWLVAPTLASILLTGMATPALAADFFWESFKWDQSRAGTGGFDDQNGWPSSTGSDWNSWTFQDYADGGYTHTISIQSKSTGTWKTLQSRYVADSRSTGRVDVYLPEGSFRFQTCIWTPDGDISHPGCLFTYGWNS